MEKFKDLKYEIRNDGEEIRPGGAYAVYILMGKLYVDTRNVRGDSDARELIKKVVESVLRNYSLHLMG